jgi:hypothetical protein
MQKIQSTHIDERLEAREEKQKKKKPKKSSDMHAWR